VEVVAMKLVPKDPFINALPQMRDLSRLFNLEFEDSDNTLSPANWTPAVDIAEKDDHFLINADVPGVDPKDIEVSMENGFLTIKGDRESETKDEKNGYSRVERSHGSFYRRFSLPDTADPENVSANSNKGVLQIKIGKAEVAKPKKITIDVQ
jgi:HSP20 family protein